MIIARLCDKARLTLCTETRKWCACEKMTQIGEGEVYYEVIKNFMCADVLLPIGGEIFIWYSASAF